MIFQNIFVWLVWIFCFKTLSKRFGIIAIGKPVGEVDVLTFRTKRTFDMILASPHQGTQSVLIFEPCLTCNKQNSWPKHPSGAVQRVMFYRSQAGIRAWPGKSNTPIWEGTTSPSAETQCWETKHKSINMAEVLKRKVKGSVNTSHYDLWGTYRSVGVLTSERLVRSPGRENQSLETLKRDLGVGCLLNWLVFQDPEKEKPGIV